MATSQQGKKKKKVLSQQQIDKLLGMLQEEDKPLRAGILAKTLGYQSARDINPTLLRLEGYGTVSRVTMNNTPLWKYVNASAVTAASLTGASGMASVVQSRKDRDGKEEEELDKNGNGMVDGVHMRLPPHVAENGGTHTVLGEVREDSYPSRPQSTKADLEWDPTDIQVHHDEENGVRRDCNVGDTDFHQLYNDNGNAGSAMYMHSQHGMPNGLLAMDRSNNSNGTPMNGNGINEGLNFTTTGPGYVTQDLYGTMDSCRQDQINLHNMNGMEGKMSGGGSFVGGGQEYIGMSAYNGNGEVNLSGTGIPNNGYNLEYTHQNSQNETNRGGASDVYMMSNNNLRQMSNGITGNSMPASNLQNFPLTPNQVHSDYAPSSNYTSSITSSGMTQKGATSSSQSMQQNYNRDTHSHNHYNQNSYTSSSNGMGRIPTYVVQEIIKPESVGQYGMGGPQGETRTVGGYQSMHPHGIDPGVMPYSQQPYHTTGGMTNGTPSTSHHHQQQQQMAPTQQPQHHTHQQQQPLAQATNFVNVGTFTNGSYNQFPGTYGMGPSGRSFGGHGTGYGSGGITSKDLANYSGSGSAYRGVHLKRQHFNGYTTTGMFSNQRPPVFGKVNHIRPPFAKHGFERNQTDRRRGNHSRSNGGNSRGQRIMNNGGHDETKGKHSGSCDESAKVEANKYLGTEVLDDICRRLAATSVQKKTLAEQSSPSSLSSTQAEDTANCKGDTSSTDKNNADCAKREEKGDVPESKETKVHNVVDSSTTKTHIGHKDSSKSSNSSGTAHCEKLPNGVNNRDHLTGTRPQNSHRGYGGTCKYQQYPYRSGYHGRETSRHHHHHRNNNHSSRNANGRPKGSPSMISSENGGVGNAKLTNENQCNKVVSAPTTSGKAECTKEEKDASQGSEKNAKTAAEVLCDELGGSTHHVSDDRPLAKYRALLVDHLDPNNVLLSHLFVRGLIDRVLVDQVRRMKTRRDAMDVLLPALLGIPQDAVCAGFCDALHKSGQVYLSELIKCTGLAGEPMTEKHAAYLKLHHQNIAASMIPDKDLLMYLRTDSVLTSDLHRFISTQPSRAQQIDTLLQVLPFRGDKAFETFRTALRRSGQPWLAEQIAMDLT